MSSQKKQIEEYSASDIESLLRELPPSALAELYELIGEGGPPPPSYTEFCQKTSIHTLDPWQVDMTTRLNDSLKAGGARIMIHKPPQHGGSHYLSQRLPAWVLGCDPTARVKICCYNIERAVEHGKVVTDIMKSPEYREIFPKCIIPKNTPQAMWSTLARKALMDGQPSFHCIGMESGFTGYGVDTLIIDDPYPDFQTALSESFNKSIELFWRGTVRPRLNKNTNVVVMYHRYTDWDFVSWLKDEADWTELRYPALCDDPDRDLMGRKEDEPLSPRYDYEWYCNERDKNPTYFAALYQGAPLPEGGGDIKTNFFNIIKEDAVPPMRTFCNREAENHLRLKILVADIAVSEKTRADWSVIMPVGVDSFGNYYLFRPWRKRSSWVETQEALQSMAYQHKITRIVIEKAGQIGGLIDVARRDLTGVVIHSAETSKDKSVRQKEWAAELETGKIFLVNDTDEDSCDWIRDFLHECRGFPGGKHDDQVDCVGLAIGALRGFYSAESSKGDAKAIYRFKSG